MYICRQHSTPQCDYAAMWPAARHLAWPDIWLSGQNATALCRAAPRATTTNRAPPISTRKNETATTTAMLVDEVTIKLCKKKPTINNNSNKTNSNTERQQRAATPVALTRALWPFLLLSLPRADNLPLIQLCAFIEHTLLHKHIMYFHL